MINPRGHTVLKMVAYFNTHSQRNEYAVGQLSRHPGVDKMKTKQRCKFTSFENWAILITSRCLYLSDTKTVGLFYLVSMPREAKYSTQGVNV